jgi:hypothetical protein
VISARTRRFAKWSAIFSFALGMARASRVPPDGPGQDGAGAMAGYHRRVLLAGPGPGHGHALAHMLRADAEAVDARDGQTPTVQWSLSWPAEGQDGPGRRRREAERDQSVSRDQTPPKRGPQGCPGSGGPYPRPAQPQVEQAWAVARWLAAVGRPVTRRALRSGGVTGSNQALNALARRINAEQAGATQPETVPCG